MKRLIGLIACMFAGAGFVAFPAMLAMKEPAEVVNEFDFDAWMKQHMTTCRQCRRSMENPDVSICEKAFAKLKEHMK